MAVCCSAFLTSLLAELAPTDLRCHPSRMGEPKKVKIRFALASNQASKNTL